MASHEAKDDDHSGLPTEVLIKIALSIPDATTLFSFLEAVCPYIALGPLEQLYQLGRYVKHSDLWPSLALNASTLQTLSNSSHLDFVKYYASVKLTNGWNAIEWLKTHLDPRATIDWQISMFPETTTTTSEWAAMPVTHLKIYLNSHTPYTFSNKLPRLPHLTSLSVVEVDYGDLEVILEYLAKSEKITTFEVFAESGDWVGEAEVRDLLEWFRRQPVRELDFNFEGWEDLSPNLRQTLCEAMFNCTSMERLALRNCYLNDMDFSKFTFSMKTLELDEVSFDNNCVIAMAKQLEGSNVSSLEVKDFLVDGSMEGIECLLSVLPRTNINTFGISNFRLQSDSRDKLPPLIQNCGLKSLIFGPQEISSAFARSFSTAIQNNQTISALHLFESNISIDDLRLLIQSFAHSSRFLKHTQFKWTFPKSETIDDEELKHLKAFATERGCEFDYCPSGW